MRRIQRRRERIEHGGDPRDRQRATRANLLGQRRPDHAIADHPGRAAVRAGVDALGEHVRRQRRDGLRLLLVGCPGFGVRGEGRHEALQRTSLSAQRIAHGVDFAQLAPPDECRHLPTATHARAGGKAGRRADHFALRRLFTACMIAGTLSSPPGFSTAAAPTRAWLSSSACHQHEHRTGLVRHARRLTELPLLVHLPELHLQAAVGVQLGLRVGQARLQRLACRPW